MVYKSKSLCLICQTVLSIFEIYNYGVSDLQPVSLSSRKLINIITC